MLFVIYIAEQREIGLGLNTHIFEFDCFFAHEATFDSILQSDEVFFP